MSALKKIRESEINFLALSKKEKHPNVRIRLLGLSHIKNGVSYRNVAKMLQVVLLTVQNWANAFKNFGLDGLKERRKGGPETFFPKEKESELKKLILKKQKEKNGGRLVGDDIRKLISKHFGVKYSLRSTYRLLHRIGLVWISSRSKHPKSDEKVQKEFKANFKKKVAEVLPNGVDPSMVDLWVQDEARFGQQGRTTRMWSEKGSRPRAIKQLQYTNAYLFGAVCPSKGLAAAIIVPYIGIVAMQKHLDEISKHVPFGRHAVVLVDRAAWHMGKSLDIPSNISLLPQPPYSPELNSCEQIWQFLREHYLSNRCFDGYDDIVDACVKAWNKFRLLPGKITSLCSRSWMVC